ncbi:uncharacterized protein LOC129725261 [Wyeomyia smithii]|uniref:uncharacterized protein LOC129725261 n=1 Tax=Wyeomyia smithii TaxID=174621 RepID=UPI0024681B88|nr:uncharacterized protein LOC129725261 [Wyeomyia smithii]XP_055536828.1 uncharacterized protein LOC129725261 [Wyeomyia smithii]
MEFISSNLDTADNASRSPRNINQMEIFYSHLCEDVNSSFDSQYYPRPCHYLSTNGGSPRPGPSFQVSAIGSRCHHSNSLENRRSTPHGSSFICGPSHRNCFPFHHDVTRRNQSSRTDRGRADQASVVSGRYPQPCYSHRSRRDQPFTLSSIDESRGLPVQASVVKSFHFMHIE